MLAAAGGREQGWRSRSTGRQGTQGGSEVGTTSRLRRTPRGRTVAASPSAHGKASVGMFMDLGSAHRPNWREETALEFEPFVERQVKDTRKMDWLRTVGHGLGHISFLKTMCILPLDIVPRARARPPFFSPENTLHRAAHLYFIYSLLALVDHVERDPVRDCEEGTRRQAISRTH